MWWMVSKRQHESEIQHLEADIENQDRIMQIQLDEMKTANDLLFDRCGEMVQDIENNTEKSISLMKEDIDSVIQSVIQHIDELNKRQNNIETSLQALLAHQEKKLSDDPWIEVLGGDVDNDKGLELQLDWNDAFIEQLRAQGYTGSSDSTLVGKYLLQLGEMVGQGQSNI